MEPIYGPVFTIYPSFNHDFTVDLRGTIRYATYLIEAGARWLYLMPYNGRYNQLSDSEIESLGGALIRLIGPVHAINLIVAVPINYSTQATYALMNRWSELGEFCVSSLVGERLYSSQQLVDHYSHLNEFGMPIVAHEMPMIAGISGELVSWPSECLIEISELPNVVGIKEDSKSVQYATDILNRNPGAPLIFAGRKSFFGELVTAGLSCYLNGISMVEPRLAFKFFHLIENCDNEGCRTEMQRFIREVDDPFWDDLVASFGWHRVNRASLFYFKLLDKTERSPMPQLTAKEYHYLSNFWDRHKEVINGWI